jgi:excisionase family DNA binding protein
MFTVQDICDRYGVTEHTVLCWLRTGELRGVNVGRTPGARKPRWRITAQALTDFEAARTATPPAPRQRRRRQRDDVIEFYR